MRGFFLPATRHAGALSRRGGLRMLRGLGLHAIKNPAVRAGLQGLEDQVKAGIFSLK